MNFDRMIQEQTRALRRAVEDQRQALRRMPVYDDGPRRRYAVQDAVAAGASAAKALFDLYDITTTTFKIRGLQAATGAAWMLGVKKSIGVSGVTWDTDHWNSGTLTAAQYVYLAGDRAALTWTMTMATTLPDGSHSVRIKPLWYVPWIEESGDVAAHIDKGNRVDMRGAVQIEGMA